MDTITLTVLKIIFLLGFTLHNLEEAIWLPEWTKYAKNYHQQVTRNQFVFAVIIITIIGYIITVLDIVYANIGDFINYIYLGFIGMMAVNTIFPHLISTIALKKYTPGLITALLLNLPISLLIITHYIQSGINIFYLIISVVVVSIIILISLKPLFKLGEKLITY